MTEQQPIPADMLYLDAEPFVLIAESQPPLEPRERVRSVGRPFPGLLPKETPTGADSKEPAT